MRIRILRGSVKEWYTDIMMIDVRMQKLSVMTRRDDGHAHYCKNSEVSSLYGTVRIVTA